MHHAHRRLDLFRQILAVVVVYKISESHVHADGFAFEPVAVVLVIDGDKPDAEEGEDMLEVVADFEIVPSESREVLDDDATDFAFSGEVNHPRKIRSVKVCAGESVVAKFKAR